MLNTCTVYIMSRKRFMFCPNDIFWQSRAYFSFVPKHKPVERQDIDRLLEFVTVNSKILAVTGAGISTESGIPDYRSDEVGLYARSNYKPVQFIDFLKHPETRQRYWARNYVGWPNFSQIQPNGNHFALSQLEKSEKIISVITQNVDNLHSKAGSQKVVELHGTAFKVVCLGCDYTISRHDYQKVLKGKNPDMDEVISMIRPDGDVEISQEKILNFEVSPCPNCSGPLKPDIVFFGDNVPRKRVEHVRSEVTASDALLVLGSSLTVFSSYRIILQAKEEKKRVAVVNIGPTRADDIVDLKISSKCGELMPFIANLNITSR